VACHSGPNLTDGRFHNLGVPEDPKAKEDPRVLATARFVGKVSGFPEYRTLREDPGRFLVTKNPADWKAFATPPLREVAATAPICTTAPLDPRGGGRLLRPWRRRRPEEIADAAAARAVEGRKGVPPGVPRHGAFRPDAGNARSVIP